jgi:hypothetical protein
MHAVASAARKHAKAASKKQVKQVQQVKHVSRQQPHLSGAQQLMLCLFVLQNKRRQAVTDP